MTRPDVQVMQDLLVRVKAATGPDRWLDYEIFGAFATPGAANPWDPKDGHFYTASFDAALALVDHELPGVFFLYARGRTRSAEPLHAFELLFGTDEKLGEAEHEHGPLAILAALLTALIAAETEHG